MSKKLNDAEIDTIYEQAEQAAINAWGPLGSPRRKPNPYPAGSDRAEIWDRAFSRAYARENGY
jgi:hypothetical protein